MELNVFKVEEEHHWSVYFCIKEFPSIAEALKWPESSILPYRERLSWDFIRGSSNSHAFLGPDGLLYNLHWLHNGYCSAPFKLMPAYSARQSDIYFDVPCLKYVCGEELARKLSQYGQWLNEGVSDDSKTDSP